MSTPKGSVKRSMILDQALELFVQKGYAATSMEDIVKHTGVSKGSIYYHFSSKDDLFVSMVEKSTANGWRSGRRFAANFRRSEAD